MGLKVKSRDLKSIRAPHWDQKGLLISCAYSGEFRLHIPTLTLTSSAVPQDFFFVMKTIGVVLALALLLKYIFFYRKDGICFLSIVLGILLILKVYFKADYLPTESNTLFNKVSRKVLEG